VDLPSVESFTSHGGNGVSGVVAGHAAAVGRRSWLETEWSLHPTTELDAAAQAAEDQGRTPVWVGWHGEVRAVIDVSDTIKESSAPAIRELRELGLRPILLTGDNARAARAVAAQVGIGPDDVISEVLPADKVDVVKRLQDEGKVVAMVGDGVNDAAALAQSDLGLAMGTGTDVAIEASDLTLVRGDLRSAPDAIRLARATLGTIKGNLFWAFAYNVAALPLAALGMLNPVIAGAAMAFSSIFVVTNSLRLRGFTPSR
jgi:Cu+-exporting ATPase